MEEQITNTKRQSSHHDTTTLIHFHWQNLRPVLTDPHTCTPLFSMILTTDQRKNYTSRYPPTSTTRRHHLRSWRTYRSSVIPPLLHPLPTPLSLKFCDHQCPVRTQTHNLSNSESSQPHPSKKKMPLKKGTFVPAKKNCQTHNPTISSFFYHTLSSRWAFWRLDQEHSNASGCIQTVFSLYSDCIQSVFSLYSTCIKALFRRMHGECWIQRWE
jgi:hypothetical protein